MNHPFQNRFRTETMRRNKGFRVQKAAPTGAFSTSLSTGVEKALVAAFAKHAWPSAVTVRTALSEVSMSLPTAIVTATGMVCGTVLLVVVASFIWAATHR